MYKHKKILLLAITIFLVCLGIGGGLLANKDKKYLALITDDGKKIESWYSEKDDIFYFFLPSYIDMENVSFDLSRQDTVTINGKSYTSTDRLGDISRNETLKIQYDNSEKNQTIRFVKSSNLATIYIDTTTDVANTILKRKGKKEVVRITVIDENGNLNCISTDATVKSRGNSTWYHSKKPLGINFNDKQSLLGMRAGSKWVLLADFLDKSAIRNKLVMDVAKESGLENTPDNEWVDLYLNGDYYGLYLLCQAPETWYEWCDQDTDGLYCLKTQTFGRYKDTSTPIVLPNKTIIDVCYPKEITWVQRDEITEYIKYIDENIRNNDSFDFSTYFDLESWAKKYLVDEIFENYDSGVIGSYFYVKTDNKLYGGPIWDYDNSIGNESGLTGGAINPQILYANKKYRSEDAEILWYSNLYDNLEYLTVVKEEYKEVFLPIIERYLDKEIDEYVEEISNSKQCNDIRWGVTVQNAEVEYLKRYLQQRIEFLSDVWVNGSEYVAIKYYEIDSDAEYKWVYLKRGEAVTDSYNYYKWFEKIDNLYLEGTDELFDLEKPVTQDVTLCYKSSRTDGKIKVLIEKYVPDKKLLVCLASILLLPILLFLLTRKKIQRI